MNDKIFVVAVCGPTASGKTRLGIDLAKRLNGEIISADSMQIYKKLSIATAKPDEKEKDGVPHHLMDFLEPTEAFSVADYVIMARRAIADIAGRGRLPIIVGGTGLYISSLLDNIEFDDTGSNYEYRDRMRALAAEKGNEAVYELLRLVDPESAERIHPNNLSRVIRALEVYETSGKKMSDVREESRRSESPYRPCMLALDYEDREQLYERINLRVSLMLEAGLVEEARDFFAHSDYVTAAQAIGYKELKPYFDGNATLEECAEALRQSTRKYAKRQLTWFRRDERIHWLKVTKSGDYKNILDNAEKIIKSYSIF